MKISNWNIEMLTGYKPITTFYQDFSIADKFGKKAIIDTYHRAFGEWKKDYKYITELVMVLNWKIFEHFERNNDLAEIYNDLWEKLDLWAQDNLKGEELSYYYKTTD